MNGKVVLLVVGMALAGRHQRQMKAAAAELATTLGFQVLEGPDALRWMAPGTSGAGSPDAYESLPAPMRKLLDASRVGSCIAGTVEGIRVAIFYETRGGGKSRTKYTVVRAWYTTPLPYELRIGHEGGFTRIGKALCNGDYDHLPEPAFFMVGTIEGAVEKAKKLAAEAA